MAQLEVTSNSVAFRSPYVTDVTVSMVAPKSMPPMVTDCLPFVSASRAPSPPNDTMVGGA